MNDFTKEELKRLRAVIDNDLEKFNDDQLESMLHKIQSMIDNYCEHEWVNGVYCEKCGVNR